MVPPEWLVERSLIPRHPLAVYRSSITEREALAISTPQDPEEMLDEMVPQLSQQLVDRLLAVATEYLACMSALEALSASSDDPAVQSVVEAAAAVRDVVAGRYGEHLTTQQLEKILRATVYGFPPETLN